MTLVLGAAIACAAATYGADAAKTVPRIISLSPHITELLFAAGAGDRIVGVDDSSDYPPAVARITRVGEPAALDVEGLLKLRPTLIVLWDSGTPASRKAELERLKLRLYVTDQHHLDDIGATLIEFGRLAGTLPVAAAAARSYRTDLAQLRSHYAARPRLRVFYQVWDRRCTRCRASMWSARFYRCAAATMFLPISPRWRRQSTRKQCSRATPT